MNRSETAKKRATAYWAKLFSEERKAEMLKRTKGRRGTPKSYWSIMSPEERKKECDKRFHETRSNTPWNKGIPCSKETKRKLSKALKGRSLSEETKRKMKGRIPWNKGKSLTEEHKQKLRGARKELRERQGYFLSSEAVEKLRKINTGRMCIEETREKISEALKEKYREDPSTHPAWKDGRTVGESSKEYKRFRSARRRAKKAKNGGTHTMEEWEKLKKRCNYTCQACGRREPEIQLTEDHIVPVIKGGSDDISNIQALCQSCNSKKNTKIIDYRN